MSFNSQTKVASPGFHVFKNTIWENVKMGEEISAQIETNEASKMIDPSQPAFTCSKLTIETVEQRVKYVQS